LASKSDDTEYETDQLCGQIDCESQDSSCTETDIADKTIGDFANAKGKRSDCKFSLELPDPISGETYLLVTRSIADTWTHSDVIREGHVARSEVKTCSIRAPLNQDISKIDPCDPKRTEGMLTYNEEEITHQTQGQGGPELEKWSYGRFKTSGGIADPNESIHGSATCYWQSNGVLSASFSRQYCKTDEDGKKALESHTLSLGGLPKAGGKSLNMTLYKFGLIADEAQFLNADDGMCQVTLEVNEETAFIEGSATCNGSLKSTSSLKTVGIEDVSFGCFLPEDEPEREKSKASGGSDGSTSLEGPSDGSSGSSGNNGGTGTGGGSADNSDGTTTDDDSGDDGTTDGFIDGSTNGNAAGGDGENIDGSDDGGAVDGGQDDDGTATGVDGSADGEVDGVGVDDGGTDGDGNCNSTPDRNAQFVFENYIEVRSFVNSLGLFPHITETGFGTGGLYHNGKTARKVCDLKGYERVVSYSKHRWASPRDNTSVAWKPLYGEFFTYPSVSRNQVIDRLVCKGRTATACE
jgi:hypothetical protein